VQTLERFQSDVAQGGQLAPALRKVTDCATWAA